MRFLTRLLFGHGWYIPLYVLFYLFVLLPVLWGFSEIDYILNSKEFTGPGYGTWEIFSMLMACWGLFLLLVLAGALFFRLNMLGVVNFLVLIAVFLVCSYLIFHVDLLIGGFPTFLFLIFINAFNVVGIFYLLWRLQ